MREETKSTIKQLVLETLFAGAMGLAICAGLWDGVL
jgi:hypothetical protein